MDICRSDLVHVRFKDGPVPSADLTGGALELRFPDPDDARVGHGPDARHVEGVEPTDQAALRRIGSGGRPALCWAVLTPSGDAQHSDVRLQIHEFSSTLAWSEPVRMGIDDGLVERMRHARAIGQRSGAGDVIRHLRERLLIDRAVDGDTLALATSDRNTADGTGVFSLHGLVSADVQRGSDGRLLVTRVTPRRKLAGTRYPIVMMRGDLAFVDVTHATVMRGAARAELDEVVGRASSYLGLWGRYQAVEQRLLRERAREFGWARYVDCTMLASGGWRFHLDPPVALIDRWGREDEVDLAATTEPPPGLASDGPEPAADRTRVEFVGGLERVDPGGAWVDVISRGQGRAFAPPPRGFLSASVVGDETRLKRRDKARELIATAQSSMPQLGLLLEGRPIHTVTRRTVTTIPARVRAKFPNGPTDRQEEALRVAFNTPDVALIQGPPGTGKTDVIAALETWLAETGEGDIGGQVLLSSYQHDAVDNAVARSTVLDLPARRIGGQGDRSETGRNPSADRWIDQLAATVRHEAQQHRDARVATAARKVESLARRYELSPGNAFATADLLEAAAEAGVEVLPATLRSRMTERARELRQTDPFDEAEDDARHRIEIAVRALRTTTAAYADDGRRSAALVAAALSGSPEAERETIRLLRALPESPSDDELEALRTLKHRLLDQLLETKTKTSPIATHDAVARSLLRDAISATAKARADATGGLGRVLERYADALEADRPRAHDTLARYTTVLAATCQQSVAPIMLAYKPDGLEFETVIIDEAARANPLDLMVPLAHARRRIVLVGDQAQLPHILEPEVERDLDEDVADETREALRESLFARLFDDLRARELRGEPKRVVTLDTQFRMHPTLGDFVSRCFYEPRTVVRSGRPANEFAHRIPRFGEAVAAWVELPNDSGRESKGKSKSRDVEAEWIATQLPNLMQDAPFLSFGVITAYARQRTVLLRRLERTGIAQKTDSGELVVAPRWAEGQDLRGRPIERLRVGTVDAFQGMEFDVVLFSLTRSSRTPALSDARALRARYGHLMLINRLCVAMSRQKRLLVVVGDGQMVEGPDADAAVAPLVAFRRLCEGEHGVVLGG